MVSYKVRSEQRESREINHTSKGNVRAVEVSKGELAFGLSSFDLPLVLGIQVFTAFHGYIPLFQQLVLSFFPSSQQPPQVGIIRSFSSGEVAGQFLDLGLELGLNIG